MAAYTFVDNATRRTYMVGGTQGKWYVFDWPTAVGGKAIAGPFPSRKSAIAGFCGRAV